MKYSFIIGLFVTVTLMMGPAWSADLSSNIMRRVNWANQYLDEAEGQISSGRAEFAGKNIKGAREEFGNIAKHYGGSYDAAHPTLTTLEARIKTVADKVQTSLAAPQTSAPAKTVNPKPKATTTLAPAKPGDTADKNPTTTDPLPNTMKHAMEWFNSVADSTIENIETMSFQDAGKYQQLESQWVIKKEGSKGKFHPQHPAVLALDAKTAKADKLVAQIIAKADSLKEELAGIMAIIQQSSKRLEEAHENAKWKVRSIASAIRDTKGNKANKLQAAMEKAREPIERVNALLPAARQAVTEFRQQYPDRKVLEKLVGYSEESKVRSAVEKVESFPKNWLDMEVGRTVALALDRAQSNIKAYGFDHLAELEGSAQASKEYAANSSQEFVVVLSSILLETTDVLLPELPEADRAVLPEFVEARKIALDRAVQMRADIVKAETAIRKINKDIVDSKQRKLAAVRFPTSAYHGGQWDSAEKVIKEAFKERIHDKELLKIDIYSPWEVREEAKWRHDHWEIKTYRYIGANCLAKLKTFNEYIGEYRVYRMNFRNTKMADGSWSNLELWSVGHSYEILQENIGK